LTRQTQWATLPLGKSTQRLYKNKLTGIGIGEWFEAATVACLFAISLLLADNAPSTLTDALNTQRREGWVRAAKKEYGALARTGTFARITPEIAEKVKKGEIKVHGTREIPTIKLTADGKIDREKLRVVVQGFSMIKGIHYISTYSPSARLASIRFLVALCTMNGWRIIQADIPNAYLNGKCPKLIVVRLPKHWNEIIGNELGNDGEPVILVRSLYDRRTAESSKQIYQIDSKLGG